ncbi:MAG: 1-acyl-sn-glycerol-3-phosphate acyltransferase [Hyphomicrobiaceae bacterium]
MPVADRASSFLNFRFRAAPLAGKVDPQEPFVSPVVTEPEAVFRRTQRWTRLISKPCAYFWGIEVAGRDRVPDGPFLLVANHLSTIDPFFLVWAMPRVAAYLSKVELLRLPWLGKEMIRCGAFPVSRGDHDGEAYRVALTVLEAGHPVGLYPEGSRSPNGLYGMRRLRSGAARLALATGVPIVPIALVGTDQAWPSGKTFPRRGHLTAEIGEPIASSSYMPPTQWPAERRIAAINEHIDGALRRLLPPDRQTRL